MQILRAPNDNTVTRVTSVGEVKFVNGIATEFTPEQAQFFTQRQRNYLVENIVTEEETAEATVAATKDAEAIVAAERVAAQKVAEEREAAERQAAVDAVAAVKAAASKKALEDEAIAEKPTASAGILLEIGDASFREVRAFAKANGINAGGSKQDIIERIGKVSAISPPSFADSFPNVGIGRSASAETSPDEAVKEESPPTDDEKPAAHITGLDVQGETSDAEETEESTETTEAAQGDSDGAQSAPTATSSSQGISLPTGRDSLAMIVQWCREHAVDENGTKTELLVRIYEDKRFKQ